MCQKCLLHVTEFRVTCHAPKNSWRKLSWHCINLRKFSPLKVSHYTVVWQLSHPLLLRGGAYSRRHLSFDVLAQVLSDKLIATKAWWSLFDCCSFFECHSWDETSSLRDRKLDTNIQARNIWKLHSWEGAAALVQLQLPKRPGRRGSHARSSWPCRYSFAGSFSIILSISYGGCDYLRKHARMRSVNGHTHIQCLFPAKQLVITHAVSGLHRESTEILIELD